MNKTESPIAPVRKPIGFTLNGMTRIMSTLSFLPENHALRGEVIMGAEYEGDGENGKYVKIMFQAVELVRVADNWVTMAHGRPIAVFPASEDS